jgi:UDP-N-acetylglucosamine 2-epimerase (non-hydrolysing)
MHILHVVGARPNFMKVAPVMAALEKRSSEMGATGFRQTLVHTGQHYDANMSEIFFRQLGIPEPDINLDVGSASHAVQTAEIMTRFERVVLNDRPDLVLVYGDVNSTVAAALVCAKLLIPVGHVEAGLRSFDRTMPEEINRLLTDQLADLLFTPSADGDENLLREGVAAEKIHRVGNVMIDTLVRLLPLAEDPARPRAVQPAGRYALVTLHRPSNVDEPAMLEKIMSALADISRELEVIFPIHPRTRQRLQSLPAPRRWAEREQLHLIEPLSYLDFLSLQRRATVVITDSGGIQEETSYLGVPCLTLRRNTERPITVTMGTNAIIGDDMALLKSEVARIVKEKSTEEAITTGCRIPLWDGKAGERIAEKIWISDF